MKLWIWLHLLHGSSLTCSLLSGLRRLARSTHSRTSLLACVGRKNSPNLYGDVSLQKYNIASLRPCLHQQHIQGCAPDTRNKLSQVAAIQVNLTTRITHIDADTPHRDNAICECLWHETMYNRTRRAHNLNHCAEDRYEPIYSVESTSEWERIRPTRTTRSPYNSCILEIPINLCGDSEESVQILISTSIQAGTYMRHTSDVESVDAVVKTTMHV